LKVEKTMLYCIVFNTDSFKRTIYFYNICLPIS